MNKPPCSRKIALFLPFLGSRGAHRVMLNLANGFAAAGQSVDFVLAERKGELLAKLSGRVRLIDLKSSGGVLRSLPALAGYLRRERPAILLTALDYVNALAAIMRAVAFPRLRLFVSSHTSLLDNALHSPWYRDRFLPSLVRMTYCYADGIIAVSHGVADVLTRITRLPKERVRVIYNPVVTSEFAQEADASPDHAWFDRDEPPVVLGAGSLTPAKDFATLIKAFAIVRRQQAARLVLLGEGEERSALNSLAIKLHVQHDVALPGWVPNPYAYMSRAAVFVLSSRWEGFGLVLAEALACGTPVVSTDCRSGPAEILEYGRYGALVPMQNPEEMARAILAAINNTCDRGALKARGFEFSVDKVVQEYLQAFGYQLPKETL